MNSTSLAGRVASLLPNTTAAAESQTCLHSCSWSRVCYISAQCTTVHYYLCCQSGCWDQGCHCKFC